MDIDQATAALAGLELFEGIDRRRLAKLASAADERVATPGQVVVREGAPGVEVVVLLSGEATVSTGGVVVGSLGAGGCAGEMAVLDGSRHSATVAARTSVRLLAVPAPDFRELVDDEPVLAARLAVELTRRLRVAQSEWAQLAADRDGEPDLLADLTPAEQRVVLLLADGLSNAEIAGRLFLSPHTVGSHLKHAYRKLGVDSRVELVARILRG
jgi:DNA-binding CsgD family transcriptional regulator/signal-transduction protein with cAMP-binding, CBS, and nucleotidyltransferase domain